MNKTLLLFSVLLLVGCATPSIERNVNATKKLSLEEKVIGAYERILGVNTYRGIFLESGVMVEYKNNQKVKNLNWQITDNEIYLFKSKDGAFGVFRIEPNGDLTAVAGAENGKRTDFPKEKQFTLKKIE